VVFFREEAAHQVEVYTRVLGAVVRVRTTSPFSCSYGQPSSQSARWVSAMWASSCKAAHLERCGRYESDDEIGGLNQVKDSLRSRAAKSL
jgi:hypothetical protein